MASQSDQYPLRDGDLDCHIVGQHFKDNTSKFEIDVYVLNLSLAEHVFASDWKFAQSEVLKTRV